MATKSTKKPSAKSAPKRVARPVRKATRASIWDKPLFSTVSNFGVELFLALTGLWSLVIALDVGVFMLGNTLASANVYLPEIRSTVAMIASALVVWLAVTVLFYLRTRKYVNAEPRALTATWPKAMLNVSNIVSVLVIVSFVLAVVNTLMFIAVGAEKSAQHMWLGVILPSAIAAALHAGLLVAYNKRMGREKYASIMAVAVCLVIMGMFMTVAMTKQTKKNLPKYEDPCMMEYSSDCGDGYNYRHGDKYSW